MVQISAQACVLVKTKEKRKMKEVGARIQFTLRHQPLAIGEDSKTLGNFTFCSFAKIADPQFVRDPHKAVHLAMEQLLGGIGELSTMTAEITDNLLSNVSVEQSED